MTFKLICYGMCLESLECPLNKKTWKKQLHLQIIFRHLAEWCKELGPETGGAASHGFHAVLKDAFGSDLHLAGARKDDPNRSRMMFEPTCWILLDPFGKTSSRNGNGYMI